MNQSIAFHRSIHADLKEILSYYESEAGIKVANEFFDQFQTQVITVGENPAFFPRYRGDIRRANLKHFPYHFLYEIHITSVWIFVLRHDKRNPSYGMGRL